MNWKAIIVLCMVVTAIVLGSLAITNKTKTSNCPEVSHGTDTCTPVWQKKETFKDGRRRRKERFSQTTYKKRFTIRSRAEFAQHFNAENPLGWFGDNGDAEGDPQSVWTLGKDPTKSMSLYGAQTIKGIPKYDEDASAPPREWQVDHWEYQGLIPVSQWGNGECNKLYPPSASGTDDTDPLEIAQCTQDMITKARKEDYWPQGRINGVEGGDMFNTITKPWAIIDDDYPEEMLYDDPELGVTMDIDKASGAFPHPLIPDDGTGDYFVKAPRFVSKLGFLGGLFILNGTHISVGCGMWPAYWLNGYVGNMANNFNLEYAQDYVDNYTIKCDVNKDKDYVDPLLAGNRVSWPMAGEVDLIEETNWTNLNLVSFHGGNFAAVRPRSMSGWSSLGDHGIDMGFKGSRQDLFDGPIDWSKPWIQDSSGQWLPQRNAAQGAAEYGQYNMSPTCGYYQGVDLCQREGVLNKALNTLRVGSDGQPVDSGGWQACPAVSYWNAGTSQAIGEPGTYGPTFNAMGGGVYATRWIPDKRFTVYFYPKNQFTEANLAMSGGPLSDNPDPDSWDSGQIYVDWEIGSPAEPTDDYPDGIAPDFPDNRHQPWNYQYVIFNIAVGGQWAGDNFPHSCVLAGDQGLVADESRVAGKGGPEYIAETKCGDNPDKVTTACGWGGPPTNDPTHPDNSANYQIDGSTGEPICMGWGDPELYTGCWGSDKKWYNEGEEYPAYTTTGAILYPYEMDTYGGWRTNHMAHDWISKCMNADPDNVDPETGIEKDTGCFDGGLRGNSRNGLQWVQPGNFANQPVEAVPDPRVKPGEQHGMYDTQGQLGIASGDAGTIGGDTSRTGPNPWMKPTFFTKTQLAFKSFSIFQVPGQDYALDTSLPIEQSLKISPPIFGAVPGTRGEGGIAV